MVVNASRYLHRPGMGYCRALSFCGSSDVLACGEENGSLTVRDRGGNPTNPSSCARGDHRAFRRGCRWLGTGNEQPGRDALAVSIHSAEAIRFRLQNISRTGEHTRALESTPEHSELTTRQRIPSELRRKSRAISQLASWGGAGSTPAAYVLGCSLFRLRAVLRGGCKLRCVLGYIHSSPKRAQTVSVAGPSRGCQCAAVA